ncbi:acyl-CoA dehydrogenase family protein [Vibrio splendidus]
MMSRQLLKLREYVESTRSAGREIGRKIDANPNHFQETKSYPLVEQINRLGLPKEYNPYPIVLEDGEEIHELSVEQRCVFYEALAYVEPNLIFACPTPGMAGFVVQGMGNEQQKERFLGRFRDQLSWSCFAMSEPKVGSDAGNLTTTAKKVSGGYLLNGEKFFIGNGINADIGVVFAKTNPSPIGTDVFLFEPKQLDGLTRQRIPVHGTPGCNISHLVFENAFLPDHSLLGSHLKPTQRFSGAALTTFDSLRPCVGGLSLGAARALLEHSETTQLIDRHLHQKWLHRAHLELESSLQYLLSISRRYDQGHMMTKQIGLAKTKAVQTAETVCDGLLHKLEPGALVSDPLLSKLYRDIKCFEYAEGTRNIHLLNGASLFKEAI